MSTIKTHYVKTEDGDRRGLFELHPCIDDKSCCAVWARLLEPCEDKGEWIGYVDKGDIEEARELAADHFASL